MTDGDDTVGETGERAGAPAPDDPRKPASPTDLHQRSWRYVLRTTVREFSHDQCLDQAAALTYYAILAAAPALLALLSLLGLFGNARQMVDDVVGSLGDVVPEQTASVIGAITESVADGRGRAGIALVLGLLLALWSASGYVGAFGRAMNRIYEIDEGRPLWKLRPVLLLVTVLVLLVAASAVLALVLTGPLARAVGDVVGLGGAAVTTWDIAKWPVVLVLVITMIAVLYDVTPNVRQPRFRWISPGAVAAILVWGLASLGFGFYVTDVASYDATYGSVAGIIVLLLWLWIGNLALLLGGELDAELERGRELQGGIAAEERVQLPPRDTRASDKRAARRRDDVERGRALREGFRDR